MISTAEKHAGEVALLVVGLDGFQQINDMLGPRLRRPRAARRLRSD